MAAYRLLQRLEGGFLICDGAYGTTLQAAGLPPGACPDLWTLERPDAVADAHRAFAAAGCDILQTNTFAAGNRIAAAKSDLQERVAELIEAGVRLAREAAGESGLVICTTAPTGQLLQPYGPLDPDEVREAFEEQAAAAASAKPDGLLYESFFAVEEAEIAVRAAKATGLPVLATMTFEESGRTVMGASPEQAVAALEAAGADVIGVNCSVGPAAMEPVALAMRAATDRPVMAQPNAGMPQLVQGRTVFPGTPGELADFAEHMVAAGVNIVGGCCGSTPEHMRAVVRRLRG